MSWAKLFVDGTTITADQYVRLDSCVMIRVDSFASNDWGLNAVTADGAMHRLDVTWATQTEAEAAAQKLTSAEGGLFPVDAL